MSSTHITFANIQDIVNSENPESMLQFIKKHLQLKDQDLKGSCFSVGCSIDNPAIDISLWELTSSESVSIFARMESDFKTGQALTIEVVWKNDSST
jgi:hypothetical protein